MEDKKYVIVSEYQSGGIISFYMGNRSTDPKYLTTQWHGDFHKATVFSLCEANEMIAVLVESNKANRPVLFKIREIIPAKLGNEVKSHKDEILEELLGWRKHSEEYLQVEHYRFFKRLLAFIENNTENESKSQKDEILEELLGWQKLSQNRCEYNHYRFFKRLFTFIDNNTK